MTTKNPLILRVAVPTPLRQSFDYYLPKENSSSRPLPGVRVRVPFQHRELIGILIDICSNSVVSGYKLKHAIEIIDQAPVIPKDILALCIWAADYYHHPVGDVLDTALPVLLRQGKEAELSKEAYWQITEQGWQVDTNTLKRAPRQMALLKWLSLHEKGVSKKQLEDNAIPPSILKSLCQKGWVEKSLKSILSEVISATAPDAVEKSLSLNTDQQIALAAIQASSDTFQVFLLDGVTGSGKTEVYLQAIADVLAKQKQVLVLVPEIGLTPQTIQRFRQRFAVPVLALHSGLTDKERLNAWVAAKSGVAAIIIGTRSAIFSPFANLGLIVVDEEHDLSFKQQEGFRYHARDLAIMRAQSQHIPIVLGSATPSLETLARALQGRYQRLSLPQRAGSAEQPSFCVLDIRRAAMEEGLSTALVRAMQTHLNNGDQVMLFLNRRGFAPVLMCHSCGWMATCKRCDARMTFHHDPKRLHCHHCDARKPVFNKCETCKTPDLQIIGLGTERLELAIQKHFPTASIARIDRDSTQRKGSIENLLENIHNGEHRILIGTQMLAKGHHFKNVTLVGIIDMDGGLFSSDFRAIERMGQLVLQVAGRAGRAEKPGTVVIQTHHPDNPLLQQLLRENYYYFATTLLKDRESASMPPYAFLALFRAEAPNMALAMQFLQQIKDIADRLGENIPIWGPVPAPMARRAGRFRVQLLIQAKQRPHLQRCLKRMLPEIEKLRSKQQVRWSLDVDPLDMF